MSITMVRSPKRGNSGIGGAVLTDQKDNMGEADDNEEEVELLGADRETIDYHYPITESTEIVDNSH